MAKLDNRINKLFISKILLFQLIGTLIIYTIFLLFRLRILDEIGFFPSCVILAVSSVIGAVFSYSIYEKHVTQVSTIDYVISILLFFIFGAADVTTSIMQAGIHTSIVAFWVGLSHFLNLSLIIFRLDKKHRDSIGMPGSKEERQFLGGRLIAELKAWAYIGIIILSMVTIVNLFHTINFSAIVA